VVLHVVILELALAALIANGAVHRMVDEVELHATALVVPHRRRVGRDLQALLDPYLAAGHEAAGSVAGLDQAHAALAGDGEARVVAEVRDGDANTTRRLDKAVARVGLHLHAVDEELHLLRRRRDLRLSLRGAGLPSPGT